MMLESPVNPVLEWGLYAGAATGALVTLWKLISKLIADNRTAQERNITALEKYLEREQETRRVETTALVTQLEKLSTVHSVQIEKLSAAHREETKLFLEHLDRRDEAIIGRRLEGEVKRR